MHTHRLLWYMPPPHTILSEDACVYPTSPGNANFNVQQLHDLELLRTWLTSPPWSPQECDLSLSSDNTPLPVSVLGLFRGRSGFRRQASKLQRIRALSEPGRQAVDRGGKRSGSLGSGGASGFSPNTLARELQPEPAGGAPLRTQSPTPRGDTALRPSPVLKEPEFFQL